MAFYRIAGVPGLRCLQEMMGPRSCRVGTGSNAGCAICRTAPGNAGHSLETSLGDIHGSPYSRAISLPVAFGTRTELAGQSYAA